MDREEGEAESVKAAEALMAKALQECPGSGVLWAEVGAYIRPLLSST